MENKESTNYQHLMLRALSIRHERIVTLNNALEIARQAEQLFQKMLGEEVEFSYLGQNGEIKNVRGTLNYYQQAFKHPYTPNPRNIFMPYYDLNAHRWCTFHVAFLLQFRNTCKHYETPPGSIVRGV
ncbi:SH3 beta-barrel fold-containing protein [uncultured Bacteroides sp.]|uniref:SH3 beta-barrel fold-containing protein n=1 Tax=uncultured Bacteroides sp. TaxID=162156 RepID=UPI002AA5E977|nr:SH3 beta-barrel fold-containing protein [uncultured Bacteroides sp.]